MINTKRKCNFGKIMITILTILFIMIATPNYIVAKENTTKLGDINGDQQIDISDLVLLLRHISAKKTNKNKEWILKEEQIKTADVTRDNKINSSDVLTILRYIAAKKSDEVAKKHKEWLEIRKEENSSEETEKQPVQEETKPEEPEKRPTQEEIRQEIPNKEEKIAPEKIELNQKDITITKNETMKLIAKITPETANINQEMTWSSSNVKVATVDNKGTITAKGEGTASITVKTGNGKTASCTVTVKETMIEVTGIKLNKTSINIEKGNGDRLTATIEPANATNKTITWSSSNNNIVTVSNEGFVTAKGTGTASITVKTANGKTASCTVTVREPIVEVTGIKLNKTSTNIEKGNAERLTATVEPANATNKTITWSSSNNNVATVSSEGFVTATGAGTASITAKTTNGKTASCTVTVREPIVEATGITLNKATLKLEESSKEKLSVTVQPTNTTNKTITWSSSNTSVATVANDGTITAKKAGTASITAKTVNGKTASCTVTVEKSKKKLTILFVGNSKTHVEDIPGKFRNLAKSGGYTANVTSATIGGKNLEYVASKKKSVITKKAYDYVIMQEQSNTYQKYNTFLKGAKAVKKLVRNKNANTKLVIRQVWLYKSSNAKTRKKVYNNASNVAKEIGASLVYDGKAFDKSRSTYAKINLFKDNIHQSKEGAYLSACCIYSTVYGKSPVGLSYTGGLSKSTAQKLQKIAASIYGF